MSDKPAMVTCDICKQTQTLSSMAVTVDDGNGAIGYCCYVCEGEQVGHKFDSAAALVLYEWDMNGSADDFMSSEGWGYCAQFGRWLLVNDDRGFVSAHEYADVAKATAEFAEWYAEGWGADESDAYVSHEGYGRVHVSFDGKSLDVWAPRHTDGITERRALARVRLEMMRTGYYPNVWLVNERGTLSLVKGI